MLSTKVLSGCGFCMPGSYETFMEMLADLEDGEEDANYFFKIPFFVL